jgi:hypothetical protein
MKQAIKILQKRYNELAQLHQKKAKELEEPELNSAYEFTLNGIYNIEKELTELSDAITILNKNVK